MELGHGGSGADSSHACSCAFGQVIDLSEPQFPHIAKEGPGYARDWAVMWIIRGNACQVPKMTPGQATCSVKCAFHSDCLEDCPLSPTIGPGDSES